jgi:hypothetical protein
MEILKPYEHVDIYDEDDNTQWDIHLNLKYCLDSYVFDNIYPFIMYGEAHPHHA